MSASNSARYLPLAVRREAECEQSISELVGVLRGSNAAQVGFLATAQTAVENPEWLRTAAPAQLNLISKLVQFQMLSIMRRIAELDAEEQS